MRAADSPVELCVEKESKKQMHRKRQKGVFQLLNGVDTSQSEEIPFLADLFFSFQAVLFSFYSNTHWAWIKLISFLSLYEMAKAQGTAGLVQ